MGRWRTRCVSQNEVSEGHQHSTVSVAAVVGRLRLDPQPVHRRIGVVAEVQLPDQIQERAATLDSGEALRRFTGWLDHLATVSDRLRQGSLSGVLVIGGYLFREGICRAPEAEDGPGHLVASVHQVFQRGVEVVCTDVQVIFGV